MHEIQKAEGNSKTKRICLIGALVLAVLAVVLFMISMIHGSQAVKKAFDREQKAAQNDVYQYFYDQGFQAGEAEYHLKNRAVITLGNIRETANLEVLSVSDITHMIEDNGGENQNIQSWIEVPGTGVFTVDLSGGEFLVDDERLLVFARVPKPELLPMNINIDHTKVRVLHFVSNAWTSSVRDGERLAEKQLNEARTRIQEDITSNLQYYEYAESAARSILENLIRAVNSDIPELKVEIEFF